jgi:phosphopantetheine--protein transferase-like protein
MSDRDALKEIVSRLYRTPAGDIGDDFSLRHPQLKGSAGRGLLAAAIKRRLGSYVPQAVSAATYGELEAAMFGGNGHYAATITGVSARDRAAAVADVKGAEPVRAPLAAASNLSVGVDIEMIDSLPEADDFWRSDFYLTHFTQTEIAYCVRQVNPRMHFAARWCAKEALAKCDPAFIHVDPATVQVSIGADGRPVFDRIGEQRVERLPHAVSLTHTPLLAAAVVAVPSGGQS